MLRSLAISSLGVIRGLRSLKNGANGTSCGWVDTVTPAWVINEMLGVHNGGSVAAVTIMARAQRPQDCLTVRCLGNVVIVQ